MHVRIWRYFQRSQNMAVVTQAALSCWSSCADPASLGISASLRSLQVLQITETDYEITPPHFQVVNTPDDHWLCISSIKGPCSTPYPLL